MNDSALTLLAPLQEIVNRAPVFILVLVRVSGLVVAAPVLGSAVVPIKVRALAALVLAAAVFPCVPAQAVAPDSLAGLAVGVGSELLIGITMGFALSLLWMGMEIGADLVGYQMGIGLAELVDPNSQIETTMLSALFTWVATLLFVLMNGPALLVRALAQTFLTVPLLGAQIGPPVLDLLTVVATNAFVLGFRIAAPALTAIFLTTLALGFVSRTMPQLNILAAGFPIRIVLGLALMAGAFGATGWLFEDSLTTLLEQLGRVFL